MRGRAIVRGAIQAHRRRGQGCGCAQRLYRIGVSDVLIGLVYDKWHDGRPFTAEDVKFTFEYYRDGPPNRHSHHVSAVPRIERSVIGW